MFAYIPSPKYVSFFKFELFIYFTLILLVWTGYGSSASTIITLLCGQGLFLFYLLYSELWNPSWPLTPLYSNIWILFIRRNSQLPLTFNPIIRHYQFRSWKVKKDWALWNIWRWLIQCEYMKGCYPISFLHTELILQCLRWSYSDFL